MPPLISIIIPAYNSSKTIKETLESVKAQTYTDYEVIVVDDNSKDNTVELVRRWINEKTLNFRSQAMDLVKSGVSVVSAESAVCAIEVKKVAEDSSYNKSGMPSESKSNVCDLRSKVSLPSWSIVSLPVNGGPAAARNRGIQEAHGDWIAFLDADDIWLPYKLELQMQLVAKHPEVVMWCALIEVIPESGIVTSQSMLVDVKSLNLNNLNLKDLAIQNPVCTGTVLIRRNAVDSVHGFDTQFRGPEDYDLWLRIVAKYTSIKVNIVLTGYRVQAESISCDERKFLPQVLRMLDKAYGSGGALSEYQHLKNKAVAAQYFSASWLAFLRGARGSALYSLFHAFIAYPLVGGRGQFGLWCRYLVGKPERRSGLSSR